jgi:hypothetical protein
VELNEELLRRYRDAAFKILQDNQNQVRDGIEHLVEERLPAIMVAAQKDPTATAGAVLELAQTMFALGYTVARLGKELPTR